MNISAEGLALIQSFEKCSLTPYIDAVGVWTVGWGHALTTSSGQEINTKTFGTTLAQQLAQAAMMRIFGAPDATQQQADSLLTTDLTSREAQLSAQVAADTTQSQFDAMFSFTYNVGIGNFAISAVKRLHNAGNREVGQISLGDLYQDAVNHVSSTNMPTAFVHWSEGGGQFYLGLFRRRIAELLVYSGWDAAKAYQTAEAFTP
jgi:lysozyme